MNVLEKLKSLPEPLYSFFWSDEPRFICEDICFLYGESEGSIGEVSWFVAPLLTKELPPANLPQVLRAKLPKLSEGAIFGLAFELNKKILQKFPGQFPEAVALLSEWERKKIKPMLSEQDAHQKTVEIEAWYLDWKKQNEAEVQSEPIEKKAQTVSLPILDALSKYQRLSEQTVTEDRIVVKGESSPVRGSLRNWLRHYRDAVGIRKHSTMERGQFLFQGDNTKRLSAMERERVSFLLKSLDENTPVSIDTDRQEIIFPAFEERGNAASATTAERVVPMLETSFRPLEKFPAQAAPIRKALEWNREEVRGNVLPEKRSEVSQQKASTTEVAAPFGNIAQRPVPEVAKSRVVGVSAPVYAPASPPAASGAPIPQQGNMSFSSSHVLPHEKAIAEASTLSQDAPEQEGNSASVPENSREPEAISVIRPRGNHFGFRGSTEKETSVLPESGSDASRVVNLRSSGGRNVRGRM